jgi:Protein of unknown function (DUF1573)
MKYLTFLFIALFSSLVWGGDAQPLTFDPSPIVIKPTIDDVEGTYEVTVKNRSDQKQIITGFKGGCGCISHQMSVQSLEPGASAKMKISFVFGDSVGDQQRKMALLTMAQGKDTEARSEVMLTGIIPTPLTFTTRAAIWFYQSPPVTKTIKIEINPLAKISNLTVETPDSCKFIEVQSERSADGASLLVRLTPRTTNIEEVSPVAKAELKHAYVVSYQLPSGVRRYEKIFVLLAVKPKH